jgi:hypothetical protein
MRNPWVNLDMKRNFLFYDFAKKVYGKFIPYATILQIHTIYFCKIVVKIIIQAAAAARLVFIFLL